MVSLFLRENLGNGVLSFDTLVAQVIYQLVIQKGYNATRTPLKCSYVPNYTRTSQTSYRTLIIL